MSKTSSEGRVANKVAIVTGAAKGMGASHARMLAKHGAKVVLTDVADAEGEALAREIGADALYVHLDVSSGEGWKVVVNKTLAKFGRIDVLVNNAGIYPMPADPFDEETYRRVIAVNLDGVFLGMKYVTPEMKKIGGGSVVNISSTAGLVGHTGPVAYTASKFGVTGLSRALAIALGPDGIRVNTVHPGPVPTLPRDQWPPEMEEAAQLSANKLPIRRLGTAEDLSFIVLYLASDESSFSTGAAFTVDGGSIA